MVITILLLLIYCCLFGMAGMRYLGIDGDPPDFILDAVLNFIIAEPGIALMVAVVVLFVGMFVDGLVLLGIQQANADRTLQPYLHGLQSQNARLESSIEAGVRQSAGPGFEVGMRTTGGPETGVNVTLRKRGP